MKIWISRGNFQNFFKALLLALFCIIMSTVLARAELNLQSLYPTLGMMGEDMQVTLMGTGFDQNTRVSMYLDAGNQKMIVGVEDTPGMAMDVAVQGSYAYVADYTGGFQVFDISSSSNPQIIGSVDTLTGAKGVSVRGNYAYVVDGVGLKIVNISNPQQPNIIGSTDTTGNAWDVFISGHYAYVADYTIGLQIIDISIPENPQITGSVNTGYAQDVFVSGNYAYIANGTYTAGFAVVDISDPENPQKVGSKWMPGNAKGVCVSGNYAYVVGENYLEVFDISNPENPIITAQLDIPSKAESVTVSGNYVYVTCWDAIHIFENINPATPQIVSSVQMIDRSYSIFISNSYAYIAAAGAGLAVIDISTLSNLCIVSSLATYAMDVFVSGSIAYVADYIAGLLVIDISNPSSPQIIGSADTPCTSNGVYVSGNYAYVANASCGLEIIDISNPENPQNIGTMDTGSAESVVVSGNYAYVADGYLGLQIIDISNPGNPQNIGSVDTPCSAQGVFISGSYAYVADVGCGLQIIDISNPSSPQIIGSQIIGSVNTPINAYAVTVSGSYAYVAAGGLVVIDISNPSNPQIIGSVNTPSGLSEIFISGEFAYVSDSGSGLLMIDITNPASPQIEYSIDTPFSAHGLAVSGSYAYLADGNSLVVLPLPVEVTQFFNLDNNTVTLPSPSIAGLYTLKVFNDAESSTLLSAVSFTEDESIINSKAIIVAGGGPMAFGGNIWDETKISANKAYDSLILQGYQHESIYYISEEVGNPYVDCSTPETFKSALSDAIIFWSTDASSLILYFVDHGQEDELILHHDAETTLTVSVQELDSWLDTLQSIMPGQVTFIYDACQAGSFVPKMRPPDEKERIVITSASHESAYFLENGQSSFSFQFWDKIMQYRGNLGDAFIYAKDSMQTYQNALVEANWDIECDTNQIEDINITKDIAIKRAGYAYVGVHPYVTSVSDPQILSSDTSATIWASGIIDAESVGALIIPPDVNPETSGIPISDLDTIELIDMNGYHTYETLYNGFEKAGTYAIAIKAKATHELYSYINNAMMTQNVYSPTLYTYVTKTNGIQNIDPDNYEDDNSYNDASVIVLNDYNPQLHNFHDEGDVDWIKFYGIAGELYKIKASNLSMLCDVIIELFDCDGTNRLVGPINSEGEGGSEYIDWSCPQDGIYYVKISSANLNFGETVNYELKVYRPTGAIAGWIKGLVFDSTLGYPEAPISGALIKTNAKASAISLPGGGYLLVHPPGTWTLSAEASGYDMVPYPDIFVGEGAIVTQNISLTPLVIDSDEDTIPDSEDNCPETYNPGQTDSDNDGDGNACDTDDDNDGMPDDWEEAYGLDPLTDDALEDADNDGYSNLDEYQLGSNPTNRNDPEPKVLPWLPILLE